jgi:hypothetical protein
MSPLAQLTSAVSFVAMALSLWLGCYVITRSPRSRLARLAGLTLAALAGFSIDVLISINPSPATAWWLGWPVNTTLAIWYHLSHETLPPDRARRQRPVLLLVYGLALVLDVLEMFTPAIVTYAQPGLGVYTQVFERGPLFPLLPIYLVTFSALTLYNFWTARQAAANLALRKQLDGLVRGTVLGVLGVGYTMTVISLSVSAPTLPIVLALGLGVSLLGYSVVRYSAIVDGRILRYDFVFSGLLVLSLSALYLFLISIFLDGSGLPMIVAVVIVTLVIVTHTSFDLVRRLLDWPFVRRTERALRTTLRVAASEVGERKRAEDGLRGALAAVVVGVDASWGAIALREEDTFVIRASFHWRRVGEHLPAERLDVRELTVLPPDASARALAVIAPLIAYRDPLGAILLGQPKGGSAYGEHDLDLVAEAADRLAELVYHVWRQEARARELGQTLEAFRARERQLQADIEALRSPAVVVAIDSKQVAEVEDALRRLHDYSYLGEHALGGEVLDSRHAATHLDRGKALNAALIAAVEKLRPAGSEPRELPPREWHPYLVLRDAYVNGDSNRDIMSKLYVSEATFHRTRRSALRAVAKALFEMDFPVGPVN